MNVSPDSSDTKPLPVASSDDADLSRLEELCCERTPEQCNRFQTIRPCYNRNGVRGIYTLLEFEPKQCSSDNWCLLRNGFYLMKTAKTDEKVRYTYSEMTAMIRTVLFTHVFEFAPECSMLELVNSDGEPYEVNETRLWQRVMSNRGPRELTIGLARRLLDELFGENFSGVTAQQLNGVYREYQLAWRYTICGSTVLLPSSADYVLLQRFMNAPLTTYTDATLFVNTNLNDHHVLMQSNPKRLDRVSFSTLIDRNLAKTQIKSSRNPTQSSNRGDEPNERDDYSSRRPAS